MFPIPIVAFIIRHVEALRKVGRFQEKSSLLFMQPRNILFPLQISLSTFKNVWIWIYFLYFL